jgi:uncharacterized repeat protein (TIGR03803 family)
MRNEDRQAGASRTTAILVFIFLCASICSAATEKILHNFSILPHGANPESNLISDNSGNLYGTTSNGGYGVVFELTPMSGGEWTETILHTFVGNPESGPDGAYPAAGLVFDPVGNLYGTTSQGGTYGQGTVYKLTPSSSGKWKETVIHEFAGYPTDGATPAANLVFDTAGNLYGTTAYGGSGGNCGDQYTQITCGTVFELSPVSGYWVENILYNFQGGSDGCAPVSSVTLDDNGNVYGTTELGGTVGGPCYFGAGTVFKLTAVAGVWTESVLYAFMGTTDGAVPLGGVIFDLAGNLYGTASYSSGNRSKMFSPRPLPSAKNHIVHPKAGGCGVVFELSPSSGGTWTDNTIYTFNGGTDGCSPGSNLIFDSSGNLYGTTLFGGSSTYCSGSGCGTIFELSPGSGGWTESVFYGFTGGSDGAVPLAAPFFDSTGDLYATASSGARTGCKFTEYYPGCGAIVRLAASKRDRVARVLYDFPSPYDGSAPLDNVIADASGNLYGTTEYGGDGQCHSNTGFAGCGTVFELSPTANGNWKRSVLYSFAGSNGDGANPGAGLVFDSKGNLYGTTQSGGSNTCNDEFPCGTVFELARSKKGAWVETVIHDFDGTDGFEPMGGLVFDREGVLYGTTQYGGAYDTGTVFELFPDIGGWTESVLYSFDGGYAQSSLILDKDGNLYGTTLYGTAQGSVFELTHSSSGWTETTLYTFTGNDGEFPKAGLVFDKEGALYGTTEAGGLYDAGIVFKLTPGSRGVWTETVLHNFVGVNGDGAYPESNLIFDSSGNLYGTTTVGGIDGGGCGGLGCGIAFELTPTQGGEWKERVLHRFTGELDGGQPYAGFILDTVGNLYSTTSSGGVAAQGTVFEITP